MESRPDNNFPVDHYSASSMCRFSTNPILFKIMDINRDRFDTTTNASAVLGQAFHKAMEVYYGGSDLLIPSNEKEAIEYGLKAGMEFLENYNDGFINYSKTLTVKQKLFDKFSYVFNQYVQEMPYEDGTTIAVEEKIVEYVDVEWRGERLTLPVKLKGYIDRIFRENGKLKIKDYKTCYTFSNPEKIDAAKIIQAVEYYLLVYAKTGEEPYSIVFDEVKYTENSDGGKQVKSYEVVFAENELYFDFYFRFYEDMTRALNGEMVFVPNVDAMFDNEVAVISYIHRLDIPEDTAKLMKKHKVSNLTELLKKEIQSAGNMRKLLKSVEANFVSGKSLDYSKMENQEKIRIKLMEHGMLVQFDSKVEGATVDLYRYTPSIGLKMSKLRAYTDDVEQVLGIAGVRVLAPIRGTNLIGFEVPRENRQFPAMPTFQGFKLAIGQTTDGKDRYYDLRTAPHLLVAGASGSGKSVFLHSVIKQLFALPNVEMHLYDPKQVEFAQYEGKVKEYKYDKKDISTSLYTLVGEMEERYAKLKKAGAKSIAEIDGMPYKVAIVDEYADLAMREDTAHTVQLLAQKGRAAGIHLIVATQRASAKVISGDIKVNFPTRVVFRVDNHISSRVMLDEAGAEKLLGMGDMLFMSDAGMERLQGYFTE